jgi:hypothetical protein
MTTPSFLFGPEPTLPGAFYVRLPAGIRGTRALFDLLRAELRLPDYCGNNWDAVEECIRDLSWIPPGTVVLVHSDLPLGNSPAALRTYLSVLQGAVAKLQHRRDRQLTVVFPLGVEQHVKDVLATESRSG